MIHEKYDKYEKGETLSYQIQAEWWEFQLGFSHHQ